MGKKVGLSRHERGGTLEKNWKGLSWAGLIALALVGCSGNGAGVDMAGRAVGAQQADVIVPESSQEMPEDIGYRAHTNHLISTLPTRATGPSGLSPAQVKAAYNVPASAGTGAIAIVDAYHYDAALKDFNTFSTQFGLPTETSTNANASTNKVLQVVYASGSKPATDVGWNQEAALDIEWAHAMAPKAKIYLVEAASSSFADMMKAVNVAKAQPGVRQVSMSFGGTEAASLYTSYDSYFVQNGVSFFASGGDTGGTRSFPALSKNVIAVGGTTLKMSGNTVVSQTAWSGTGCGGSAYEAIPTFQGSVASIIGSKRAGTDISAVADPSTGVAVYVGSWFVFGGTSVSCPIIAGIANASGVTRASSSAQATALYSKKGTTSFRDVTSGTAGSFAAKAGWDYPTGLGTPYGVTAF